MSNNQPEPAEPTAVTPAPQPAEPTAVTPAPQPAEPTAPAAPQPAPMTEQPPAGYGYLPSGQIVQMFPDGKPMYNYQGQPLSPKSRAVAALLAWFLGVIGIHRFYVGKVGTGVLMIFTLGGLGIWTLIDFILIVVGVFKDKEERIVANW